MNPIVILGLLASQMMRYLLKSFLSHTVETGEEVLSQSIWPTLDEQHEVQLVTLVKQIIEKQESEPLYPYWLHEQKEIDALVYQLYGLTEEDIKEVEIWYCRRYPKLAKAQGVFAEVQQKYASYLSRCEFILAKPPGYWKSNPVLQLVARGEGQNLEFKETLEADINTGERHAGIRHSTLKAIAAFLNTGGGTLFIGVSDLGEIKGLERDFNLCNRHNQDGFEQKLRSLIHSHFQPHPERKIDIQFETLLEGVVCKIEVKSSPDIIHLDNTVFIRDGNRTIKLEGRDLTDWITHRTDS